MPKNKNVDIRTKVLETIKISIDVAKILGLSRNGSISKILKMIKENSGMDFSYLITDDSLKDKHEHVGVCYGDCRFKSVNVIMDGNKYISSIVKQIIGLSSGHALNLLLEKLGLQIRDEVNGYRRWKPSSKAIEGEDYLKCEKYTSIEWDEKKLEERFISAINDDKNNFTSEIVGN